MITDIYGNPVNRSSWILYCGGGNGPILYYGRIINIEKERDDGTDSVLNPTYKITIDLIQTKGSFKHQKWHKVREEFYYYPNLLLGQKGQTNWVVVGEESVPGFIKTKFNYNGFI